MSEVLCIGVSHKTAPIALRERLALGDARARELLREAVAIPSVSEAAVVSTCNRTELYAVSPNPAAAEAALTSALAGRAGIDVDALAGVRYTPRNCDAARHLYRVAAGLDSMIVGEAEVQGQVRHAHDLARETGTAGPMLHRMFQAALQTGKRVRAETALSEGRASVSSVAVRLAQDVVGDLRDRHVVIIGAGETSELTAQALAGEGVATVFLANRRADRARSIAARFGGDVVSLQELPEQFVAADIVVSSTASPHPLVHEEDLAHVMRERGGRPLLIIDLAVPRDVEAACGDLPGVTLFDIDDLQSVVASTLSRREREAEVAQAIVEEEIRRFADWMGQQDVRPSIAALREHGRAIVDQVLAENAGRWETASARDLARVDAIARAVMQRLLHEPTIRLRESGHGRLELVRELFGLDDAAAAPPAADEAPGAQRDNVRQLRR
ncbi:MAG TPA: glutamyl-tRNA reductase [Capillimicrobium sp.]|nr:glutamyl-tRNA reductase [Capillimicrobium sp.]